jgi:MYXO-CTERM domain-containing protein
MLDGESCLLDAFEGRENLSEINPSEPPKDGGCGCSIPGKASNSGFAGLVLAGIAIAASRFRRRKEEEE